MKPNKKRTYVGELELTIDKAIVANQDRNPNRYAEVNGWLNYGMSVAIARRGREPLPERPEQKFV